MGFASMFLCFCLGFTIVDSVDIGNFANGVAFGNGYVWACENQSDNIYKIDPGSMAIVASFYYSGGLDGLCHDGEYLWIGYHPNTIHKIDTLGGFIGSWSSPGATYSYGMAFDGTCLWHADKDLRMIYKLDYSDPTTVLASFPVAWEPRDLGWFNGHLWASADYANIYELDPMDMTVLNAYPAGRSYCSGIALGGGYLWFGTNNNTGWVYKVDGVVGVAEVPPREDPVQWGVVSMNPNPFRSSTTVQIAAPDDHIEVMVFDIMGRAVRRLFTGTPDETPMSLIWDGRTDSGQQVSSGVYFVRVRSQREQHVAKVVVTD
jgi:hypothetical protein